MGKTFTIPSIFTAVDKFTAPVKNMTKSLDSFANKAEISVARSERMFRKLTPTLNETTKQMLSFASSAAVAGAIIGGGAFSVKAVMDYETELANLKAITGASGKDFDLFKSKIKDVATATKSSAIEVTKAFTAIANNQPELLKDANALAAVTQSSIILAQASKMELGPAGEALTQILNQFGKSAMDAKATVDILAAGTVAGSSEIRDTAEAIQKFGTVAANAGIKINESVALIELSSKFEKGAEAGAKLRNILITMSTLKVQDPKALADLHRLGVNMNIVTNNTLPLNDRLKELSKIAKDDAALFHVFGKENQALATGVLSTSDNFNTMLDAVNKQGIAAQMAAENNNTLAIKIEQLKNKFVTWLVTSDEAKKSLNIISDVVVFLGEHLSTIIKTVGVITGAFLLWKTAIYAVKTALFITQVITKAFFLVDMIKFIAGINGVSFATAAWEVAQASLNAVLAANPILLLVIGIAALIGFVVLVVKYWNEWGASLTWLTTVAIAFFAPFTAGILFVVALVQSFRRNWDMITKAFKEGGILAGLKAIGATILDAVLMPLQQVFKLIAKFTGASWATDAMNGIEKFRKDIGVNVSTDESGNPLPGKEALNPKAMQQDAFIYKSQTNNAKVDINILDPQKRASAESNNDFVKIRTSSTLAGA